MKANNKVKRVQNGMPGCFRWNTATCRSISVVGQTRSSIENKSINCIIYNSLYKANFAFPFSTFIYLTYIQVKPRTGSVKINTLNKLAESQSVPWLQSRGSQWGTRSHRRNDNGEDTDERPTFTWYFNAYIKYPTQQFNCD